MNWFSVHTQFTNLIEQRKANSIESKNSLISIACVCNALCPQNEFTLVVAIVSDLW